VVRSRCASKIAPPVRIKPAAAGVVVPPPPPIAAPPPPEPAPRPAPAPTPAARRQPAEPAEAAKDEAPPAEPTEPKAKHPEAEMIADVLAALDRNALKTAAELLAKHDKQFPKGEYALEREALRIVVRCKREHSEAARIQARDFIVRTALSPHWNRIIEACRASAADPIVDPFADAKPAEK
jgi:hypothetical protein